MVKLLIEKQHQISNRYEHGEDVLIGWVFHNEGIPIIPAPRWDADCLANWIKMRDQIPTNAFHFRLKHSDPHLRVTFSKSLSHASTNGSSFDKEIFFLASIFFLDRMANLKFFY